MSQMWIVPPSPATARCSPSRVMASAKSRSSYLASKSDRAESMTIQGVRAQGPDPQGLIQAHAGQPVTVGKEGQRGDRLLVALQAEQFASGCHVPQLDGVVIGPGGEDFPVGREGKSPGLLGVSRELAAKVGAALNSPDPDLRIGAAQNQRLSIRCERDLFHEPAIGLV